MAVVVVAAVLVLVLVAAAVVVVLNLTTNLINPFRYDQFAVPDIWSYFIDPDSILISSARCCKCSLS